MSIEVKILWFFAAALIAPFVIVAGIAVGFTILQVVEPILAGEMPPLGDTIMLATGAGAIILVWSAFRLGTRKART